MRISARGSARCKKEIKSVRQPRLLAKNRNFKRRVGRGNPTARYIKAEMKRYGNLFEKVISIENLDLAERRARKGKSGRKGVVLFDQDRDGNLQRLHQQLEDGTFRTSPYTVFMVREPKEREISRLPYYPDRIVHHAIMNVCEPIWTATFTHNTHSCIKGRGISGCARQVEKIIKSFHGRPLYCLKIDIRKYYPSIDNGVMKSIIRRKIKDRRLLSLLDGIIDSAKGLPIGNYLSQYLSNLYLAYFMHTVNEEWKIKATEYADDICFYADNKAQLHDVLCKVKAYLHDRLKLQLKGNYQIFPIASDRADKHGRPLDYCGFKFYRRQKLLRKRIKQNLCRALADIKREVKGITAKELRQRIAPWWGWCKYSKSKNLIKKLKMEFQDLIKNGTVKIEGGYYDCERVGIESLVNKRIEILGYVSDIKTEHGEGRFVVHCKDGGKECKFFTNCTRLKGVLSQLPPDNLTPLTPQDGEPTAEQQSEVEKFTTFFTTIMTVRDGNRKYYKFT